MSDPLRRVLVTLTLLACLIGLELVPLPGLDHELLSIWAGQSLPYLTQRQFSVAIIGVAPWLYAFAAVELLAIIVPPWRELRYAGAAGRERLNGLARMLWLPIALLQATLLVTGLEQMAVNLEPIVLAPGWTFRLVMTLTLLTGSAVVGWICQLNARAGIGPGYMLALLPMPLVDFLRWWMSVEAGTQVLLTPALMIAACVVLLALRPPGRTVPLSVVGLAPLGLTLTVCGALGVYQAAILYGLVALVTVVLTPVFQPAEAVAELTGRDRTDVQRDLVLAGVINGVLLLALLWGVLERDHPSFGYGLWFAVAMGWDVVEELRARGRGQQAVAWQLHRPYATAPVLEALERAGVAASVRGLRTRSLLHAFGPFVPIEVLVAPDELPRARAILAERLHTPIPGALETGRTDPVEPIAPPPPSRSPWDAPEELTEAEAGDPDLETPKTSTATAS